MDRQNQIRALANPSRMTIIRLLADPQKNFSHQWSADPAEFGVCMMLIAEVLGVAQPTASRHVDLLRQAGFITIRKHQKWSYCKRDESAIEEFMAGLHLDLLIKCPE